MNKGVKIVLLFVLVGLLVCVRIFEEKLFYDPLIQFFKSNFSANDLPEFESFRLIANTVLRFLLNTFISLGILWVVFKDKGVLKLSAVFYGLLFLMLFGIFILLISSSEESRHMGLFYVRRFLIQPLFLLVLLPAFYFQKRK